MREGRFPRARDLNGKTVWLETEVDEFLEALPAKSYLGDPHTSRIHRIDSRAGAGVKRNLRDACRTKETRRDGDAAGLGCDFSKQLKSVRT